MVLLSIQKILKKSRKKSENSDYSSSIISGDEMILWMWNALIIKEIPEMRTAIPTKAMSVMIIINALIARKIEKSKRITARNESVPEYVNQNSLAFCPRNRRLIA